MTPPLPPRVYEILRSAYLPAPRMRTAVATMVLITALMTMVALRHVARRHDVVQLGYQLSHATEQLHAQQEDNRRLRLEYATLSNPTRIRILAAGLGMVPVPADQIRIVPRSPRVAVHP